MSDSKAQPSEALKLHKLSATDRLPKQTVCSSDTDGSASIDEDDLSESGSEDSCEQVRRGGSRRATPMRKRRKRPEWTRNEEETLAQVHCSVGNQWSVIASRLPDRTANEVKNIWHSTLRSKHLKARSLLRAYATALNGRWDDATARQEAYNAALGQQGTGGSEGRTSTRPSEAGNLPAGDESYDDAAQTPRLGAATNLTAAAGLPAPSPAQAQTPDSSLSPKGTLVRQRTGRGPPATAPRPVAIDKAAGRGGQQRQQPSGAARRPASPMSCPARGLQARANLIETRGASTAQVLCNLDTTLAVPPTAPSPEGDAVTMADVDAAETPPNGYVQPPAIAATTAARPLPLSFGGAWGAPTQLPPRPWPQPHLLQANSDLDVQESQPPSQLQEQPLQQPPADQRPRNEVQLLHSVATMGEKGERVEGSLPHPSHGQVLGLDPMDAWLGRLDPSMVMHDDEAAAREQLLSGGVDSANNSSVARTIILSAAAAAAGVTGGPGDGPGDAHQLAGASGDLVESGRSRPLTWPRLGQRPPGPPNAAAHHGRAGPASGAWSSNSGAGGPQLQSPPLGSGGLNLYLPGPQAAAPDLTTAMAISPTARGGGGAGGGDGITPASGAQDYFSQPAGHWHAGDSATAAYGSQDCVPALPYGMSGAAGMYPAPPDVKADPDGSGRDGGSLEWPIAAPPRPSLSFVVKPGAVGLAHEGWRGPLPSPQQLPFRSGAGGMAHAADLRGGMYMVPVHTPPSAPPPPPLPYMVYAPPPHALQTYHGHPQYDLIGRQQRQREHMAMYQQQHYIQQQQDQQQQQYEQQEQFKQQQQAYQQASQWQQQQFKQEPQEERRYQQQSAQQHQQQHLQLQLSAHYRLQQQQSLPQQRLQQQQQNPQQQPEQQQAQQPLEQHADSMSSSDIVTMGFDSLQDPQLRWCLTDME